MVRLALAGHGSGSSPRLRARLAALDDSNGEPCPRRGGRRPQGDLGIGDADRRPA